jgi:hypothetical protein
VSRKIRFALIGVGVVVVAVAVFFLVINPIRGDITELESQIADERSRISTAGLALAAAEATRSEGRRNQARLLELGKMVPPEPEIPSLILQLDGDNASGGVGWNWGRTPDRTPDAEILWYLL